MAVAGASLLPGAALRRARNCTARANRTLQTDAAAQRCESFVREASAACSDVPVGATVRDLAEEAGPPTPPGVGAFQGEPSTHGAGNNGFLRLGWRACPLRRGKALGGDALLVADDQPRTVCRKHNPRGG